MWWMELRFFFVYTQNGTRNTTTTEKYLLAFFLCVCCCVFTFEAVRHGRLLESTRRWGSAGTGYAFGREPTRPPGVSRE